MNQSRSLILGLLVLIYAGLVLPAISAQERATVDEASNSEALGSQIRKAQETVKRYGGGHVIIGRVQLDGPGDPRDVNAQMEILEDGYFAGETKDLVTPVGFRMHGYAPLDLELKGRSGEIVDVGSIHMKQLAKEQLLALRGRVQLEGQENAEGASVLLTVMNGPVNTPHNGTSPRPRWPSPVTAEVRNDGSFGAEGFSPIKYYCTVQAPGYIKKAFSVAFEGDKDLDLGEIRLERPIEITLTYLVADKPPFDPSQERQTVLSGGDRWKATPDIYGWDLEFKQEEGDVLFDYSYAPCYLLELGKGSVEDFIQRASEEQPRAQPRKQKVENGHVYLMNQAHWNRWVLFEVRIK
jgi:hypothetical protein